MKQLPALLLLAGITLAQPPAPGARPFPGRGAMGARQQQAQTPAPPVRQEDLASIEGQVTNAVSGEPLRKASVTLRKLDDRGQPVAAISDAAGHFILRGVEPGRYRLWAERNGFVRQEYGAKVPGRPGTLVMVDKAQRLTALSVALTPQAVITGRISDEDGEPIKSARVQAMRVSFTQGQRQLQSVRADTTNDLGEYRLYDLPAGRYYLNATYPNSGQALASGERYVPVYYPGTTDAATALQLHLPAGSQMQGVDLTMRRAATVTVRGRVVDGVTNAVPRNFSVRLLARGEVLSMPPNAGGGGARAANGSFEISGVTPGSYTLMVNATEQRQRSVYRQPIEIGTGGIDGLIVTLPAPGELTGQVRAEGQANAVDLTKLTVSLRLRDPLPMGFTPAKVGAAGEFTLSGVMPDLYDVQIFGMNPGYYLKSIRFGGGEVLEPGLNLSGGAAGRIEVTISPGAPQLEGSIAGPDGQPAKGATVVMVPDASRRSRSWLYRTTRADDNGYYMLDGIVPGSYSVYAFDDIEPGAYFDPDFLRSIERYGESVNLRESARENRALKLAPVLSSQ